MIVSDTFSISSNTSEVAIVAGASSMIFWCLRWTEQSRPNREMALPYWSAKICTSRWRACLANCITKIGEPGTSAWTWVTSIVVSFGKLTGGWNCSVAAKNNSDLSKEVGEVFCTVDFPDTFSSSAFRRLHHHRVAYLFSCLSIKTCSLTDWTKLWTPHCAWCKCVVYLQSSLHIMYTALLVQLSRDINNSFLLVILCPLYSQPCTNTPSQSSTKPTINMVVNAGEKGVVMGLVHLPN